MLFLARNHNLGRRLMQLSNLILEAVCIGGNGVQQPSYRQIQSQRTKLLKGGFTLLELMVVLCIIGLLAAISVPNFARARTRAQRNTCINNLRLIDWAKQQWALEWRGGIGAPPTKEQIAPYLGRAANIDAVVCPAAGDSADFDSSYSINAITEMPSCKIDPDSHRL